MDTRNLILAIVASMAIVFGWSYFVEQPKQVAVQQQQQQQQALQQGQADLVPTPGTTPAPGVAAPAAPGGSAAIPARDRATALQDSARVSIAAPEVAGSIALKGARLDDVRLLKHRQTADAGSPSVILLSPVGGPDPYYTEYGWVAGTQGIKVPTPETVWTPDGEMLRPGQPVTLSWDNGEGLTFRQRYEVDEHFMFTVTQSVENATDRAVEVYPYALASRHGKPKTDGLFILHEGPFGVFDGTLKELDYDDVEDKPEQKFTTTGGWIGLTDKYWMVTLVPNQSTPVQTRFAGASPPGQAVRYQVDYLNPVQNVPAGGRAETVNRVYAGAKILNIVEGYEEKFGIQKFNLVIDWGWFFFLTKPMFRVLDWLYGVIGNFGLAIMALTVLVKLLFFPLANKSYQAMSKMKALTPEMQRLRERFGSDRQKLNQEMMALYKKEKVNPAAGCLPILVQIPVFFALYKVLYVTIEMRHAPFFGWINDLSAPDPATIMTLFGFVPWDVPGILAFFNIGVWPLIMGITMYLQQKLNPAPADPIQAKVFMLMPIMFTFILAPFAAGLVIYWAWNNTLSILQQYVIMRRMGVKVGGGTDKGVVVTTTQAEAASKQAGKAKAKVRPKPKA